QRFDRFGGVLFLVLELGLQIAGEAVDLEVVGERDAPLAQRLELVAALGDQLVFVDGQIVSRFAHGDSIAAGAQVERQMLRSKPDGFLLYRGARQSSLPN